MKFTELEMEGTWEEIQVRMPDFEGRRLHVTVRNVDETSSISSNSIDDALADIWQTVPDSSWEGFPVDFAENLDHYLYNTPKVA